MNGLSQPLEQHEIQEMKASPEVMGRVMRSYKMMLSFYGMSLLDEETGLLDRSEYEIRAIDPQRRRRSDRSRYLNLISECLPKLLNERRLIKPPVRISA